MSSLHKLFEELPSHCADFKSITESNDIEFPMLFLSHRRAENEPVAKKLRKYGQRSLESLRIRNHCQNVSSQGMVRLAITPAMTIYSLISMTH